MLSIVIPVKNGAATLKRCLENIRHQSVKDTEIIILDSMSDDGSREIARQYNCKIIDIPAGSFNHGLTRNMGVQHATGELIFFTVQDAWIGDAHMLEKMCMHFNNEEVMGVVGHQAVPHEKDKNPLQWFRRFSTPVIHVRKLSSTGEYEKLSQQEKQGLINWDNVVAMYRRSALLHQPFEETQFAEDWIWSKNALLKGWTLLRDPSLVAYHYHHQDYHYAYRVAYAVNYHFFLFFNFKPGVPNILSQMIKAVYHMGKSRELTRKEKWYWIIYNWKVQWGTFNSHINFLLRYSGGGAPALERRYNKVCKTVPQGVQNNNE